MHHFKIERTKILASYRVLSDSLYFFSYPENAEIFCFDHKKKKMETITKISFEGSQVVAAHMRESLGAMVTTNGYLALLIFKPHKHFLVTAKLEEGVSVKILEVVGNNNYIFLHDSKGNSYLISINQEYVKRASFEFSISTKEDFFIVQKIEAIKKDGTPVKFARVIEGAVEKPSFVTRYLSDVDGRLYSMKLLSNQPSTVDHESLQNYFRSHNFEYKALFLPSSISYSLERQLKTPKGKFELTSYDFEEGQSIFQCFLNQPAYKGEDSCIVSVWAKPEPLIRQTIVPSYTKKLQPPVVDLNLNTFQDQFNANQGDQEDKPLQLESEDMPETESNLNIKTRAAQLLQRVGMMNSDNPKIHKHSLITKEMHSLVKAVERLSDGFKIDLKPRSLARNPVRESKQKEDKSHKRSTAPTRGATQRNKETPGEMNRSMNANTRHRSVSNNKSFRITNKSMAL